MEFWASSETYGPVDAAVETVRQIIEPVLQRLLAQSRFAEEKLLIRYIPIVMPAEMHKKYTARSKARITQRILDCAPQIDYNVYLNCEFSNQVAAYLDGIRTAYPLLPKFGFTAEDLSDLEALLSDAKGLALASQL